MSLKLPQFQSETEEAEWWFEHRKEVEAALLVAAAEGHLTRSTADGQHKIAAVDVDAGDLGRARNILYFAEDCSASESDQSEHPPARTDALKRAG